MTRVSVEGPQGRLVAEDRGAADRDAAGGRTGEPAPLPVILVHSDSGSKALWQEALDHLAPERRAVAIDLRGHGESAEPADGDLSYDGRAEDIEALADALGLDRFVLVGHSGGAAVALAAAAARPDRVAGVLMVDPVMDPAAIPKETRAAALAALAGPDFRAVARDYYRSIAGDDATTVARVLADIERAPQATILGVMTALDGLDPRDFADRYAGPVLSIVLPKNEVPEALHAILGIPHLAFREPGAGHWLQLDAPEAFFLELDGFLAAVDAGEAAAGE
jgi:pimeloyl-ACP methyl ester carboxylesterase